MITPEMLKRVAEGVGVDTLHDYNYNGWFNDWNPPANAEQDRVLDDWLLQNHWHVYSADEMNHTIHSTYPAGHLVCHKFHCPRNEFRTRAVDAVLEQK